MDNGQCSVPCPYISISARKIYEPDRRVMQMMTQQRQLLFGSILIEIIGVALDALALTGGPSKPVQRETAGKPVRQLPQLARISRGNSLSHLVDRLAARLQKSHLARLTTLGLAAVIVALICFSRMYLGVHYPSDVAAGVLIGLSWAAFCMATLEAIQRSIPCAD